MAGYGYTNPIADAISNLARVKKQRQQREQIQRILVSLKAGKGIEGGFEAPTGPTGLGGVLDRFNPFSPARGTTGLEELYAQKAIESRFTSPFGKPPWYTAPKYAETEAGKIAAGLEPRAGREKEGYPENYREDLAKGIKAINSGEYNVFEVFRVMAQRYPAQSSELKRILLAEEPASDLEAWLQMQPEFKSQYEAEKVPKKKFRLLETPPQPYEPLEPPSLEMPTFTDRPGPQFRTTPRDIRQKKTPKKVPPGLLTLAERWLEPEKKPKYWPKKTQKDYAVDKGRISYAALEPDKAIKYWGPRVKAMGGTDEDITDLLKIFQTGDKALIRKALERIKAK